MELMTLNSSFQPDKLIENYEALIWTERYAKNGDFELTSTNIKETIKALPLESYVSLRETTVPMVVEQHKIKKSLQGAPIITITGRSFETVLERRASVNEELGPARVPWTINAAKESDAAYDVMKRVLGLDPFGDPVSPLDAIPEINLIEPIDYRAGIPDWHGAVTYNQYDIVRYTGLFYVATSLADNLNKTPSTNPTYWYAINYEIKPAYLYTTVMELVNTNHHGLKSIRPYAGGNQVGIEIYNGADLTGSMVFDARFDQIDDATYLLSKQGSTNVGYVYGAGGSDLVLKTSGPEPSGLARRVLLVEDESANTSDLRHSRGLIELYKYNATALFDGQVAIQVAQGYNTEYFLGDILKLTGEYGLSQNVRVAEFIRTSDATGEKAYPAFEAVD